MYQVNIQSVKDSTYLNYIDSKYQVNVQSVNDSAYLGYIDSSICSIFKIVK